MYNDYKSIYCRTNYIYAVQNRILPSKVCINKNTADHVYNKLIKYSHRDGLPENIDLYYITVLTNYLASLYNTCIDDNKHPGFKCGILQNDVLLFGRVSNTINIIARFHIIYSIALIPHIYKILINFYTMVCEGKRSNLIVDWLKMLTKKGKKTIPVSTLNTLVKKLNRYSIREDFMYYDSNCIFVLIVLLMSSQPFVQIKKMRDRNNKILDIRLLNDNKSRKWIAKEISKQKRDNMQKYFDNILHSFIDQTNVIYRIQLDSIKEYNKSAKQ